MSHERTLWGNRSIALPVLSIGVTGPASADPLPGEVIKFRQLPLNNGVVPGSVPRSSATLGAPYYGHDELSTAYLQPSQHGTVLPGTYMADDFADKFNTPVVHVRWWGSYMNAPTAAPLQCSSS